MQIEKMTTVLRPRSNWEAVDLGFSMANQWFRQLWLLWMLTALPVFIVTELFFYNYPDFGALIIWWLKPLYELPLLYFLSRVLFGEYLTITDIRRNYFQIVKSMALPLLIWRRFSLSRSFNNPVQMLEQLSGKERQTRLHVLNYNSNNVGQWLTVVCAHFELFLYFSVIALIIMLIPNEVRWFDWRQLFSDDAVVSQIITNLVYFLVISLVAPFYTAAGFSLYLARRTELEGWDIELGFKKLVNRLRSSVRLTAAAVVVLLACMVCMPSQDAFCQTADNARAASVIKQVLSRDEFGQMQTHHVWKHRKLSQDELNSSLPGFIKDFLAAVGKFFSWLAGLLSNGAGLLEALLWIVVASLLIFLLLRLRIWSSWLGNSGAGRSHNKAAPVRLFGLDIEAEALPADIIGQVQQYIERGELRAALSLLYRATLIKLIHLYQLDIPESATEGECLRIVRQNRPEQESSFFQRMTGIWLRLAYAHEVPGGGDLQELGREWQALYGDSS